MDTVSMKDRERLRGLARKKLEMAHSPRNEEILKMWKAQEELRRESPTVRLLFSNFMDEVVYSRMQCDPKTAAGRLEVFVLKCLVLG